jgi:cytochrome c5
MSDAHNEQQSLIRTPKQLIFAVAAFFLVIVIGIILLVTFVTNTHLVGAGSDQNVQTTAARIRPLADEGFAFKDVNAPKILQTGQAVYTAVCAACHGTGAAGAPKIGDASAWSTRIAQGFDTLVQHAVQGIRAMPAKGGNPDLDDLEVARAVVYMSNQSGAKFKEPAETAANPQVQAPVAGTPVAGTPVAGTPVGTPAAMPAATVASGAGLAPAGSASVAAPAATASADAGKTLYASACIACHGAGIAGAPKFGDKAAWLPRIQQGKEVLYQHAIKGFQGKAGVMPPKGGSTAPDLDVKAAVDYMAGAIM